MPKRVFWPAVIVTIGLIILASNLEMLPRDFANLWPLIAVVVGLGGLLLSDREDWHEAKPKTASKSRVTRTTKRTTRRK